MYKATNDSSFMERLAQRQGIRCCFLQILQEFDFGYF